METIIINGFYLDTAGGPTANVMCEHGEAVDYLNARNYTVSYLEDTAKITNADLLSWVIEYGKEYNCTTTHNN